MNNKKNINYLVGKNANLNICLKPFSNEVIEFLDYFSKKLFSLSDINKYPELASLAFYCRKKNFLRLKHKFLNKKSIRFGIGLIFHITPSNIPTNFIYSLIFGLICGNSNIVRVPSKKFQEINIICEILNLTLKNKFFLNIKNMISIVRYKSNDDFFTKKFSSNCDARMIWGGDETISNIKKYNTKPRNIDIPFSDRYAICLINSQKFLSLNKNKTKNLIRNFYNDTYLVDQNACSSPHVVFWVGKFSSKAKKKFWNSLNELVKKKYNPPLIATIDNYSQLASNLIEDKNIETSVCLNKSLYVISFKSLIPNSIIKKTKWGFFYEYEVKNLINLNYIINKNLQTITYFGFSKNFLIKYFGKKNLNKGIDRVVPIGQALNIDLIWDGYDLTKILSREIEIK